MTAQMLCSLVFGVFLGVATGPIFSLPVWSAAWWGIIILGNFAFAVISLALWPEA